MNQTNPEDGLNALLILFSMAALMFWMLSSKVAGFLAPMWLCLIVTFALIVARIIARRIK
jgi:hypothetical protein